MKKLYTIFTLGLLCLGFKAAAQNPAYIYLNDTLAFYSQNGVSPLLKVGSDANTDIAVDTHVGSASFVNFLQEGSHLYFFGDQKISLHGTDWGELNVTTQYDKIRFGDYRHALSSDLNLRVVDDGAFNTRVALKWDAHEEAEGYLVFRDGELSNPIAVIWGNAVNTYDDNAVWGFNRSYTYQILAFRWSDDPWISDYSSEVTGKTKGATYTATAANEYMMQHHMTFSYDALSNAETNNIYYEVIDETLGTKIKDGELTLYSESAESALWDVALSMSGKETTWDEGIYAEFPSTIQNLSDDWTVEMTVRRNKNYNKEAAFLVGNNFKITYDNDQFIFTSTASDGEDGVFDNGIAMQGHWIQLTITKKIQELKIYVNGHPLPIDEMPDFGSEAVNLMGMAHPTAENAFFEDIDLGMVRVYDETRTSAQVIQEYGYLYRDELDGSLPDALVDEWVLDSPDQSDDVGLKGKILKIASSDLTIYNPVWNDVNAAYISDPEVNYLQYVTPGSEHNYTVNLYEVGSGDFISSMIDSETSAPEPSGTAAVNYENNQMAVSYITTAVAEQYLLSRMDGIGNNVELTNLSWDSVSLSYNYIDIYDFSDSLTLEGNNSYTYLVTPYYEYTDHESSTHSSAATSTLDFELTVTPDHDANTLTWNPTTLATHFGDSVVITRDGESIVLLVNDSTYADETMTYGKNHSYGLHPLVDGVFSFAQYEKGAVDANGVVRGYFLDDEMDFVLPNFSLEVTSTVDFESDTIELSAGADGIFEQSGIYYGEEATTFEWSGIGTGEFTLSRINPEMRIFAHLDTTVTVIESENKLDGLDLRVNLTKNASDNIVVFRNTFLGLSGTEQIFVNLYRDEELIDVSSITTDGIQDSLLMKDTTGVSGEYYEYELIAYFITNDGGDDYYLYNTVSLTETYPDMTELSSFEIEEIDTDGMGGTDALQLMFSYSDVATVDAFQIYRQMDGLDSVTHIATVDYTNTNNYTYTDFTGIPEQLYSYYIEVVAGVNTVKSTTLTVDYPLDALDMTEQSNFSQMTMPGDQYRIVTNSRDLSDTRHFDGFVLLADGMAVDYVAVGDNYGPAQGYSDYTYVLKNYQGHSEDKINYAVAKYKSNKDGTFIFDSYDLTAIDGFASDNLPELNTTWLEEAGYYKATWYVDSFDPWDLSISVSRLVISNSKNNTDESFELDPSTQSWAGYDELSGDDRYLLALDEEGNILRATTLGSIHTTNTGTENFQNPENVTASQDLSDGVLVQWDYEYYAEAKFHIYRDGLLIATVDEGGREYFDEPGTDANVFYAYQVEAIYDQDTDGQYERISERVTDSGMRRVPFEVEGHVLDELGVGVPNIALNIGNVWAFTDSTGHYRLDQLYQVSGNILTLNCSVFDGMTKDDKIQSTQITLVEPQTVYHQDFVLDETFAAMNPHLEVAGVFGFSAYADTDDLSVRLDMQLTGTHYDGVEVYRLSELIADLTKVDGLSYTDISGEYGMRYTYSAMAYTIDTESGARVYGEMGLDELTYPGLEIPAYYYANPTDAGYIELTWHHADTTHRSYDIYRNEELLETTSELSYTDTSGDQGKNYRYTLYTVEDRFDTQSEAYGQFDMMQYPMLPGVDDLAYDIDTDKGEVTLSWGYQDNDGIVGYKLWKNDKLISTETVDEDALGNETSFVDTDGIPGTLINYSLVTQDQNLNFSSPSSALLLYPDLPAITEITYDQSTRRDTTTIQWNYMLTHTDGFGIKITNSSDEGMILVDTVLVSEDEENSYDYLWAGGVAGANYDIEITPYTTRIGADGVENTYQAPTYTDIQAFNSLPDQITVSVLSGYEAATIITWDYPSANFEEMKVTLTAPNQTLMTYVVEASQRYLNVTNSDLVLGANYSMALEAVTNRTGGISVTPTVAGTTSVTLTDHGSFDYSDVTFSGNGGFDISFKVNSGSGTGEYHFYRGGTQLNSISAVDYPVGSTVQFSDGDATEGQLYDYRVIYIDNNGTVEKVLILSGENLNLIGQISGFVYTSGYPVGIEGVTVRASTEIDGRAFTYETQTLVDGSYNFSGLRVADSLGQAVHYTIYPQEDGGRIFDPSTQNLGLATGVPSRNANNIIDISKVTFQGKLTYQKSVAKNIEQMVSIYGINSDDASEQLLGQVETIEGFYSLTTTLNPSSYTHYQVRLIEDDGKDSNLDFVYSYYEKLETQKIPSSSLIYGDVVNEDFTDTLTIATTINFLDACGYGISGYSWKLFLEEEGGSWSQLINTDAAESKMTIDLPPVNYNVMVLDVTPLTSESKKLLEFLRGEQLTIEHGDSLISFTEAQLATEDADGNTIDASDDPYAIDVTANFMTSYDYVYLPEPTIEITLVSDAADDSCVDNEGDFGSFVSIPQGEKYSLNLQVTNEYAGGGSCDVTSGYILMRNMATADVYDPDNRYIGDSLFYVDPDSDGTYEWLAKSYDDDNQFLSYESYEKTAGNINRIVPYTRVIEAHYYTSNDRYVATEIVTVVVTGTRAQPGTDFLFDTQEEFVPLYVLHDPPGDNSYSSIQSGSSANYSFTGSHEGTISSSFEWEWKQKLGPVYIQANHELSGSATVGGGYSWDFTVGFDESISTSATTSYDANFIEYVHHEKADVIVGAGLIKKYGIGRNIAVSDDGSCEINETLIMVVEPEEVKTTFVHTVHEFLTLKRYYQLLLDDPTVEFFTEVPDAFSNLDFDNPDDKVSVLEGRINNIDNILTWHQTKYAVPVQICEYTYDIDKDFSSSWQVLTGVEDEIDDILEFCNNSNYMEYEGHGQYAMLSEAYVIPEKDYPIGYPDELKLQGVPWPENKHRKAWDNSQFEAFDEVMDNFQELWTTYEASQNGLLDNGIIGDVLSDGDDVYDYMENRTFSGLTSYTKSLTSKISSSNNTKFSFDLGYKYSNEISNTFKADGSVLMGLTIIYDGNFDDFENTAASTLTLSASFGSGFSWSNSDSESMTISYKLSDDDSGDHFNLWVMTDPTGYNYNSSPEFYLTSGKSSCPYEDGTVARDEITLSTVDENGQPVSNVITQQSIYEDLFMMFRLGNTSPYREVRFYRMFLFKEADLGTEDTGPGTQDMDEVQILGDADFERDIILFDHWGDPTSEEEGDNSPGYKDVIWKDLAQYHEDMYEHVEFVAYVAPQCAMTFREARRVAYDVYFARPVSPISLPLERGDWLVNADSKSELGVELNDLKLENNGFYQLENLFVEVRSAYDAQNDWVPVKDIEDKSAYSRAYLEAGNNVFQWQPMDTVADGEYQIRAVIYGDDGGYGTSDIWEGRIDRTLPYAAKLPEPADGLLSKGDEIGLTMSEDINTGLFYAEYENHVISVYELDSITPFDFRFGAGGYNDVLGTLTYDFDPVVSDYTIYADENEIYITIKQGILDVIDGKIVTVSLSNIQDLALNVNPFISWTFKSDYTNYPVSEISLHAPDAITINAESTSSVVDIVVGDLDIFATQSLLDSVVVSYSTEGMNTWTDILSRSIYSIRSDYQTSGVAALLDVVSLDLSELSEGSYDLRLTAWGGGNFRHSNQILVRVDFTFPEIVSVNPTMVSYDDDIITIAFSEHMKTTDVSVTAGIWNHYNQSYAENTFEAFKVIASTADEPGTLKLKIDATHSDYDLLYNAYGKRLELILTGVTDLAGNALSYNVASTLIGNFTTTVSNVKISPIDGIMNKMNRKVELSVSGFDLFGDENVALDSIKVMVAETGETLATYTIGELKYWHSVGDLGTTEAPLKNLIWNVAGSSIYTIDETYTVNAIAYGDGGKAFGSNDAVIKMDFTAPVFTGQVSPAAQTVAEDDFALKFLFSEELSTETAGVVKIYQDVSGSFTEIDNNDYWVVDYSGGYLLLYLSDAFKSIYSEGNIKVHISVVEDRAGNPLADDVEIPFTMGTYVAQSGSYATDFSGARLETGENELTWKSYQTFETTVLERSRDGVEFIAVAEYNDNVDQHLDQINFSNIMFYRLTQITASGEKRMSKAIGIENPNALPLLNVHVYPTISDGQYINMSILTNDTEQEVKVEVTEVKGLTTHEYEISAGDILNSNVRLDFNPALKPGVYMMSIKQGDFVNVTKIIVR